ncbi:GDSL esterase/lipase 1-like [Senna tora]|uniref:GDSL esterase/lipase 1-like n=1 Tax=Senna tora TaxID=362788 RepID=A0A834T1Q8_9FABA|nr:GDSL esterase/lipase 1-like [Senna tora]
MTILRIQICCLLFCASLYICHGLFCLPEDHAALFIFGDSIFDVGNNNYINTTTDFQANFWPYGDTSFKYPSGRPSDGRLIPDFIAEYVKLPLIPPYLQPGFHQCTDGANFASAGGGALVETNQGFVIDLKSQLKYFSEVERMMKQKVGDEEARRLLSKAIFLFSIGFNDYFVRLNSNSTKIGQNYVDMVIGNLTSVVKEIYNKGGRKFGFLNLPPLGCLPVVKALIPPTKDGCVEEVTQFVKLHNEALSEALHGLQTQLKGFKYSYIDFYTSLNERIKAPSKYEDGKAVEDKEVALEWAFQMVNVGSEWKSVQSEARECMNGGWFLNSGSGL